MYVKDKSSEVRQAAAYGWGVLGQFGGEQFAAELSKIVPILTEVINDPDSREQKNINAFENVISVVTKIMKYNHSGVNLNELVPLWLNWLPVIEDSDEAPHVYGYLCDLIEQNHPAVLGPGNSNIPRIVKIFAEAFSADAISPAKPEGFRMLNIIRQVQTNETMFQTVVQALTPELQQALHLALQTPPVS